MIVALIAGIVLGIVIGAVLVDVWLVQPAARENHELNRLNRRHEINSREWQRLYEDLWAFHAGTAYVPTEMERTELRALIAELADTQDHSKTAELRVVQ